MVGSLLCRFGLAFMQQGSPAWRWNCPAQYDSNVNELLSIWQRYGLLTSGGTLLSPLTLPHSVISLSGNENICHSRYLPDGLVVSKIHDRCVRSLLNLMYLLVHKSGMEEATHSRRAS